MFKQISSAWVNVNRSAMLLLLVWSASCKRIRKRVRLALAAAWSGDLMSYVPTGPELIVTMVVPAIAKFVPTTGGVKVTS